MITRSAIEYAFNMGCKMNSNGRFVNLPNALVCARDFLPDRRYKIFSLACRGNGHGDTGGLIECAGIKLWWDSSEQDGCARIKFEKYER